MHGHIFFRVFGQFVAEILLKMISDEFAHKNHIVIWQQTKKHLFAFFYSVLTINGSVCIREMQIDLFFQI